MLKVLRKKGVAKKILWVLAVMITVSFVFWGISSNLRRAEKFNYAGKVFGRKVSFNEFNEALLHSQIQAIMRYGDNFYKVRQFLDLESEAWDRIMLLREAKKRGIRISDDKVVDKVTGLPFFQRNKTFDARVYDQVVRYVFQCKARDFEEGVRESLAFEEIYNQETAALTITDEDVREAYKGQYEKVQVDYVLLRFSDHEKDVTIGEADIAKHFEENKADFKVPEAINVQYVTLEYPELADVAKKSEKVKKGEDIKADLSANMALDKLAEKYSAEVMESGFFARENPNVNLGWPFEVFQQVLALKENEPPRLIETDKGFCVVRLKEAQASYVPEFAEAKDKVKKALTLAKAKAITQQKTQEALASFQASFAAGEKNFQEAARKLSLKVEQAEPFARDQYLPQIGLSPQFSQSAFALSADNPLSNVTETANGYAILHFVSLSPINEEAFSAEKDGLKAKILAQKKDKVFNEFLIGLRQRAKIVDNVRKLKEEQDAERASAAAPSAVPLPMDE